MSRFIKKPQIFSEALIIKYYFLRATYSQFKTSVLSAPRQHA
ncbi:hypothetical protein DFQ12_5365 [Sphingobacterium detergens]|uniref:Uncharacterized protein n=1 Tax=Sphingobacterium detergens TaxID=1145106 RepID=A0A420ADF4_SPHD1|nr:hypothetical protein DFQ12_5365 [Sphingobacterium detergens]